MVCQFYNGMVCPPATSEAGARWPRFGLVVVATTGRRDNKDQMIRPYELRSQVKIVIPKIGVPVRLKCIMDHQFYRGPVSKKSRNLPQFLPYNFKCSRFWLRTVTWWTKDLFSQTRFCEELVFMHKFLKCHRIHKLLCCLTIRFFTREYTKYTAGYTICFVVGVLAWSL
jgi:hypothetical protein